MTQQPMTQQPVKTAAPELNQHPMHRMLRRGSARWLRDYHLIATLFWMVMLPLALWRGWAGAVTFVSAISIWSLVSTEWGAWQGSRAEVKAEEVKVSAERADVRADQVALTGPPPTE